MRFAIGYAPEAKAQLHALFDYIAREASPDIAERYVGAIVDCCESLDEFPFRGTPRDDLRPGLRTLAFRRRVTIAYAIEQPRVTILAVFYGGQDFTMLLSRSGEE